jgi:3-oxoacyl-[acyl-carrier protein] reductase
MGANLPADAAARPVKIQPDPYSAAKGAIDTLVKHFASALGERGIRVNAVAPGAVSTEMSNFTISKKATARRLA